MSEYDHLTPRLQLSEGERRIVRLLAADITNREIAAKLFIAEQTVKFHLTNIYRKLGVKTRTGAVMRAIALGIVALPEATVVEIYVNGERYVKGESS